MKELVLRSDVVTLKETTEKLQKDLGIDIYEAADIVLAVLREHGSSIKFWTIPSKGLPYKDDEPRERCYSNEWLESKWWDEEHQQQQDEIRRLTGAKSYQDDDRIEEMALSRKDAYRLFLSDSYDRAAAQKTAMRKDRLVSITQLLTLISGLSGGKVKLSDVAFIFSNVYDGDSTMIYRHAPSWLCEPINDGICGGYNERVEIASDLTNSSSRLTSEHDSYLILKDDAVSISQQIWAKLFNEKLRDPWEELGLGKLVCDPGQTTATEKKDPIEAPVQTEIDPADLPDELQAANIAFAAIKNGHGDRALTPKNRLIDYLEKNFPDLKAEAVQRIATVANPDKTTGRKKSNKE